MGNIKQFWYKTSYLLLPLLAVVIFMLLQNAGLINIYEGAPFRSNVSGISGTLAGFELTAVSILLTMPENRFTNLIKSNPRLSLLYREIGVAIFMLLVSMMLALFEGPLKIISYIFIAGIAATAHSAYAILRISYYSWKSK